MSIEYNAATNDIEMFCGDTGTLRLRVDWLTMPDDTMFLFAVFNINGIDTKDLLLKPIEIIDGIGKIRLCNKDTRDIPPGVYRWQLRTITGAEVDAQGNIVANDCTDNVHTWFKSPPKFKLKWGGGRV